MAVMPNRTTRESEAAGDLLGPEAVVNQALEPFVEGEEIHTASGGAPRSAPRPIIAAEARGAERI